jgi:hypothetical protein
MDALGGEDMSPVASNIGISVAAAAPPQSARVETSRSIPSRADRRTNHPPQADEAPLYGRGKIDLLARLIGAG